MVKCCQEGGENVEHLIWGIVGYFIGAIPFSYILPKIKGVDVRKVGSGNVGGTNALRAAGPLIGGLSMLLDTLKAFFPVLVAYQITGDVKVAVATAIGAVLGHNFPIYLKFRGGKGVATTLGTMFALCWQCALFFLGVWFLVVTLTQYVSLASLIGLYSAAIFAYLWEGEVLGVPILIFATLALLRHRSNVERLMKGNERKTNIWGYIKK
jgi:glycerol-3-phosphate acyltransferase PlsY